MCVSSESGCLGPFLYGSVELQSTFHVCRWRKCLQDSARRSIARKVNSAFPEVEKQHGSETDVETSGESHATSIKNGTACAGKRVVPKETDGAVAVKIKTDGVNGGRIYAMGINDGTACAGKSSNQKKCSR